MRHSVQALISFLLSMSICACGPAEPLNLSAIQIEIGESGTLFYNRAQQTVRAGDTIELSVQLPLDLHFHNGTDWWSHRLETPNIVRFGTEHAGRLPAASRVLEIAGADEVVARCDERLFYAEPSTFMSTEKRIAVPQSTTCSFLGLAMDGPYPTRYDLRTLDTNALNRVVFQPSTTFEQTLFAQAETGALAHITASLTLDGLITRFPLGEGGVSGTDALAVLSPFQGDSLGVWLSASERFAVKTQARRRVALHLSSDETEVRIPWSQAVTISPAPSAITRTTPWAGSLRILAGEGTGYLRASFQPLAESDGSMWRVVMPVQSEIVLPERPFMSETMLEQVKVGFSFVSSSSTIKSMPVEGDIAPAYVFETTYEGYFRTGECDASVREFSFWSVLEQCDAEQPLYEVMVDECARLLPHQPDDRYPRGILGTENFSRDNGTVYPVREDEDGVLTVGSGSQTFTLVPKDTSGVALPNTFQTLRGKVQVSEHIYEYRDEQVGLALGDPLIVYASPWREQAAFQGRSSGDILVRAGPFQFEAVVETAEVQASGLLLRRYAPLCDRYSERMYLRANDDAIIIEQWVTAQDAQTTLRRLFTFQ